MVAAVAVAIAVLVTAGVVAAQSRSGGGRATFVRDACAPTLADRSISVFTSGDYSGVNHEVAGRVVAIGDASVTQMRIGTELAVNPDRVDLIAGGAITASGATVAGGSATYGTTIAGQLQAPNGTVTTVTVVAVLPEGRG